MAIDVVVEEVADNLQEISEATRGINTRSVGFFLGGTAVGLALGFYFGRKYNKEKLRAEAFKASEEEVEKIRELYQQKTVAATPKPSIQDVVEEQGYIQRENVVRRPLPSPVPISAPPVVTYEGGKDKDSHWVWETELAGRLEGAPYVIHQDEYREHRTGYTQVTYTYYALDDTLVDEGNGHPLPHGDEIVGQGNLKFGHGTDDIDVVFVRNDRLEMEMEICRVPKSYEEEVLGVDPDDEPDADPD
jgi:hypothetical protein